MDWNFASCGLLTVWEKDYFEVKEKFNHRHLIGVIGIFAKTGENFICINVYAPQKTTEKSQLWLELSGFIRSYKNSCILVAGDFNAVLCPTEKDNCEYNSTDSVNLAQFL